MRARTARDAAAPGGAVPARGPGRTRGEARLRPALAGAGARTGAVAFAAILALLLPACGNASANTPRRAVPCGDPDRGRVTIQAYGCGSCHMIPGAEAQGTVGPPLVHFASRVYIAGVMPNTLERLITWLTVPQAVKPGTAMPDMGLTDGEARDVAAYLYTLK